MIKLRLNGQNTPAIQLKISGQAITTKTNKENVFLLNRRT